MPNAGTRKTCLITGASRGIGLGIAQHLDRCGYRLALTCRNHASLETLRKELASFSHTDHLPILCDVGVTEQVEAMFGRIDAAFGRLDALVVNAGIHRQEPSTEIPADAWDRLFAIDVRGAMLCCRETARRMIGRGGGIVVIGSIAGERAAARRACYCAAKAALHAYSQSVAQEWAPEGIRVNIVSPGPIDTEFLSEALHSKALESLNGRDGMVKMVPLGRLGTPQDVAPAVEYLLSDAASFITGAVLRIDGGRIWS